MQSADEVNAALRRLVREHLPPTEITEITASSVLTEPAGAADEMQVGPSSGSIKKSETPDPAQETA